MKKDQVVKKLDSIFIKIFKIDKKKLKTLSIGNFYKWDSLSHIIIMSEIEKKFQISINNNISITLINYKKISDYLIKTLVKK
tara:strand:+ start:1642 stop:1887 length:246 start_codon:yes stop_codon:yes gene_type:complete